MANLTKEQREAKQSELEKKLKLELEEKIRKEFEAKYNTSTDKAVVKEETKKSNAKTKKKIPLDTMIPCRSGAQGLLIYVSKRINGYQIEWDEYGSVEYIELAELISMRNTSKSFYVNNWVFFDDTDEYLATDVYAFLEVSKFYENTIMGDDLDDIFTKTPEEIVKIVSKLSSGVKSTIAAKARKLIDSKELDSSNRIEALEKSLNVELTIKF